jgi:hypothetical protein
MSLKFWLENLKRRYYLRDLSVDGRIKLKVILNIQVGDCGLESSSSGWGPVAGYCLLFASC